MAPCHAPPIDVSRMTVSSHFHSMVELKIDRLDIVEAPPQIVVCFFHLCRVETEVSSTILYHFLCFFILRLEAKVS